MRPISISLTPAAASTTGFDTGLTGAGPWTPGTTSSGDSLAHQVSITSTANLSAITFTVTGLDADGNSQTEDITGPNATTVNGSKYFSSVTGVSASSTVGANTFDLGYLAVAVTKTLPMNYLAKPFTVGVGVTITGTINYSLQHTFTNVSDTSLTRNWFNSSTLASKTASGEENYSYPIRALRFLVNSVTAGATVVWEVLGSTGTD